MFVCNYYCSILAKINLTGSKYLDTLLKDMPLESVPKSLGGKFELYNESYAFDTSAAGPFYIEPTVTSTASSSAPVAGKVDVNRVLSTTSSTSNDSNNSSMSSVLEGNDINLSNTATTSGATATSTSASAVADDVQDAVSNAPFLVAATTAASATTAHAAVASSGHHHHHTTKHKHRHTSPHSQTQHTTTTALPASHADVSAQRRLNKHAHFNAQDPSSSSQHHTNTANITTPTKTTPSSSSIRSIFSRPANALTPQSLSKLPSRVNSFRHPSSHMNSTTATATASDAMLKRSRSMFSPASSSSSFQKNSPISTPTTKETVSAVVNTSFTTTTTTAVAIQAIIFSTPVYIGILGIFIGLFLFYPIFIVKYVIIPVLFGLFVVYVI